VTFRRQLLWILFLLTATGGLIYFSRLPGGRRQPATVAVLTVTIVSPTTTVSSREVESGSAGGSRATAAIFTGKTNPGATVYLLRDGQLATTLLADETGAFQARVSRVTPGLHIFSLWAAEASQVTNLLSFPALLKARADNAFGPLTLLDFWSVTFRRGDLNNDGRVNLIDFSIAAYWYDKSLPAVLLTREKERLNGDGRIDMADFSIMAYYWTG
jgi:hypothetical protein